MIRLVCILLLPLLALGSVATVVRLQGEAVRINEAGTSPLIAGAEITAHERIKTARGAIVQLRFTDETLITVGANSEFAVDTYRFNGKASTARFELLGGAFEALTGKIGKLAPKRFKIRTRSASLGIRGTHFAGSYRDGTLGVLYLGRGNGVTVENGAGMTLLDAVGDGVFMRTGQIPPRKEQWSTAQVRDLMQQLTFETAAPMTLDHRDDWQLDGTLRYFMQHVDTDGCDAATRHEAIAILHAATPRGNGLRLNASLYHRQNIDRDAMFPMPTMTVLGEANLAYEDNDLSLTLGRQSLPTPLTGRSHIAPDTATARFETWDERAAVYDWWWELPTNFEALYAQLTSRPNLRMHAAYVHGVRMVRSKQFVPVADTIVSSGLANDNNASRMFLIGAQATYGERFKAELWGSYLTDLFSTGYVELKYAHPLQDGTLYIAGQYLTQNDLGASGQRIRTTLWGAMTGVRYAGALLGFACTQTGPERADQINGVLTPFDAAVAFTDTFALRNTAATTDPAGLLQPTGPYTSETSAIRVNAEYDLSRLGLHGLQSAVSFSRYDRRDVGVTQAWLYDLTYKVPQYENLFFNGKLTTLDQPAGTPDQTIGRIVAGIRF